MDDACVLGGLMVCERDVSGTLETESLNIHLYIVCHMWNSGQSSSCWQRR